MEAHEAYTFSELVLRYLKRELNREEELAFLKDVSNDKEKRKIFDAYQDSTYLNQGLEYYKRIDTDAAWNKIVSRTAHTEKKPDFIGPPTLSILKKWLPYAAVLLCILGFSFWSKFSNTDDRLVKDNDFGFNNDVLAGPNSATLRLSNGEKVELGQTRRQIKDGSVNLLLLEKGELRYQSSFGAKKGQFNEIDVSNAGKFKVCLSDGSTVWISSSSKLSYPVEFQGDERRVSLEGEAYFQVAKDANKPFYVEVGGKTIRVLGTQFNVSAYTRNVRTTLVEGSVRIEDGKSVSLLKPGQLAVFKPRGVIIQAANVKKDTAWKDGYFMFDHDPIQKMMEEISRWYEVTVIYEGNIKNEVYTGSMPRATSLGGVLQALTDISGLHFEINGRTVKVK